MNQELREQELLDERKSLINEIAKLGTPIIQKVKKMIVSGKGISEDMFFTLQTVSMSDAGFKQKVFNLEKEVGDLAGFVVQPDNSKQYPT